MKKKCYKKPVVSNIDINTGLPTVLAMAAVGTMVGAAAGALARAAGNINMITKKLLSNQQIIGAINA